MATTRPFFLPIRSDSAPKLMALAIKPRKPQEIMVVAISGDNTHSFTMSGIA
jgi:hypothetical protein